MRAVVLVGGFGTRLRPLTHNTPKQMLPILGRPMIEQVLEHLAHHGIRDAVLSLGYRPDAFTNRYPDGRCAGVTLHYAVEPQPLDTAGAIRFAACDAAIDERFIVLNGDVITDLDIGALIDFHQQRGAEGTIALHRVEDPSAFGVVPTDADGRVQAFVEKPPRDEAPTHLINAGTYVLEPSVLDRVDGGRKVSIEREVFPAMVADGSLFAMDGHSYWIDTGTPAKYIEVHRDVMGGCLGSPRSGVDDGAQVAETAQISHSAIGDGVVVERGARVVDSVLLPGVHIGAGSLVEHSVIGPSAKVGDRAQVTGLSVIGDGEVVAADEALHGVRRPDPASP